jgi:hypothetical protein
MTFSFLDRIYKIHRFFYPANIVNPVRFCPKGAGLSDARLLKDVRGFGKFVKI